MKLIDTSIIDVVEYFDDLINRVDIVIENNLLNQDLSIDKQEYFNSIRDEYLHLINNIKMYNLEEPHRFKHLRESEINTKYSTKQGDVFCFFIDHNLSIHDNTILSQVGHLIVTDFYLSQISLKKIQ